MTPRPDRNRILSVETLLSGWSKVVRIFFEQRGRDGSVILQDRDLLDRGHGVTVLLYNLERSTLLLLRQPRIIATIHNFDSGETLEACNGLMESDDPEASAMRELDEETGHQPRLLEPVGTFYASPGSSLELVHIYTAQYDDSTRRHAGGGHPEEGEDIELIEVPLATAARWLAEGILRDGRTVLALQHLLLRQQTGSLKFS